MRPSTNTRGEAATRLASTWAPYPPRSAIYRDDGDDDGGDMRPRTNTRSRGGVLDYECRGGPCSLIFRSWKAAWFCPKGIRGWIRYLTWRVTLFSKIQREAGGLRRTVGSGELRILSLSFGAMVTNSITIHVGTRISS